MLLVEVPNAHLVRPPLMIMVFNQRCLFTVIRAALLHEQDFVSAMRPQPSTIRRCHSASTPSECHKACSAVKGSLLTVVSQAVPLYSVNLSWFLVQPTGVHPGGTLSSNLLSCEKFPSTSFIVGAKHAPQVIHQVSQSCAVHDTTDMHCEHSQ